MLVRRQGRTAADLFSFLRLPTELESPGRTFVTYSSRAASPGGVAVRVSPSVAFCRLRKKCEWLLIEGEFRGSHCRAGFCNQIGAAVLVLPHSTSGRDAHRLGRAGSRPP